MRVAFLIASIVGLVFNIAHAECEETDKDEAQSLSRQVRSVAYAPNGKLLAAGTGVSQQPGELVLWDVSTRKVVWTHKEDSGVPAVAFAADGRTLAAGTYGGMVKLLNAGTGQVQKQFKAHGEDIRCIALSTDGKTLATGGCDLTIKLWDLKDGTERRTLTGHANCILSVAFSPDGKQLVSGSSDHEAKVWDIETGKQIRAFRHGGLVVPFAMFTADGRWIFTAGLEGTARVWDAQTGEIRARLGFGVGLRGLAYASAANTLAVWDPEGKNIPIYDLCLRTLTAEEMHRVRKLLMQLDDESYEARNQAEKELLKIGSLGEPELRKAVKDSPSPEVRIRCRSIIEQLHAKPREFLKGHQAAVTFVTASPDGTLFASGSKDGTVRLWDAAKRSELAVLRRE